MTKTEIIVSGKNLSRVALGTHQFCLKTEKTSREILDMFVANGGNLIDTARCYGEDVTRPKSPESERCIGRWIQSSGMRDEIVLITKGGNPEFKNGERIRNRITENEIEADITKSLEELKTDYIDIYFFHKDDPTIDPGVAIEILNKYINYGMVKHIGASNWNTQRIKAANKYAKEHGLAEFEFSEIAFSLKDNVTNGWGEKELVHEINFEDYQYYREIGLPVIGFGAQAYGFFYGNDISASTSEKNRELFRRLKNICDKKQINAHQALFGFYFGCDIKNIPLISAKSVSRLKEVIDNCDIVLDKQEMEYLLQERFRQ